MFEKQTLIRVMEKKFTQGAWRAVSNEIRDYKGLIIATVYKHLEINMPLQEKLANAKLIAAAPELLEACLMAKAMYEAQGINENSQIGGEQYKELVNAIKKALE